MPDGQDGGNHHHRNQMGYDHMPGLLPLIRAVQCRRLQQRLIHSHQRCIIDDAVHTHGLPHMRDCQDHRPVTRLHIPLNPASPQCLNQLVRNAVGRIENDKYDECHNNRRHKPGQNYYCIVEFQRLPGLQIVEHQRQSHARNQIHNQERDTVHHRVAYDPGRILGGEEKGEILQAAPRTVQNSQVGIVVLKCDDDTRHREIIKEQEQQNPRKNHQIQMKVFSPRHLSGSCPFLFCSGIHPLLSFCPLVFYDAIIRPFMRLLPVTFCDLTLPFVSQKYLLVPFCDFRNAL